MVSYPGTLAQDPPPLLTQSIIMNGGFAQPVTDTFSAWTLQKGNYALALAAEIYGWLPWSLKEYDEESLYNLLSVRFFYALTPTPGYQFDSGGTQANALYMFRFLKTNNLIGPTRVDTIARVLNWCRWNLWHSFGPYSSQNEYYIWQYWGPTPVSRIIEGTVDQNPEYPYWGAEHWTEGCGGTTGFLQLILPAANIPVLSTGAVGHVMPYFISEKLYLSHGDDPYSADSQTNYPASLLLIDEAKFKAWFRNVDELTALKNIGRRTVELALQYPGSDWIVKRYCDDQKNNRSHAESLVYNEEFKKYFSVRDVETAGVWTALAKVAACH